MIQTWAADITPLCESSIYRKYYNLVPDFRKEKADKIQDMQGKAQSVGVWILLMRMREAYGISGETVFNLSHSGQYVLCSVDDGKGVFPEVKLGCDIEVAGEYNEKRQRLAERFFSEGEVSYILSKKTEEEKRQAFYRLWVLKESFMKATRLGMKLDMRSFEVQFDSEDGAVLARQPEAIKDVWHYQEYEIEGIEAKIAVCSTADEFGQPEMPQLFR
ncbi:4'-phosphopantetheinyl transferase superfamily protein [Dorea acetigenes]|jgi:4'-phosphopantetheinyl transferase|uniref:4'-phosphopantetheinyl transferase superfamily protein n=1 Tax=Dorea acetigenes TaxID=2981787 RepID=A0ABT2RPS6_9FIRM|nr:4'-phosphopantetheinyl transferase superfamily protein [Dorea acetigenes]MCU6687420.1 4'-phosphopantetheinyl transferase superfamily protein [Dorea acetigenes]SCJ41448.1 4'-phosphopantetheinyl transferase sfp [uncultured Clostridium sp.]